jgi:fused signal recognition particle receptor
MEARLSHEGFLMSFWGKLVGFFASNKCDYDIEDILIEADFGPKLATDIATLLKRARDPKKALKDEITRIVSGYVSEIPTNFTSPTKTIMFVGINGSGKTTTVAKVANLLQERNVTVCIAACDTFRAAAVEQITVWADRLGCSVFSAKNKSDPASVAYEALKKASTDVLLIDTAGRLHCNSNLMQELSKISRVLKKINDNAPEETYITIDAATGQNIINQIDQFKAVCNISGIILNKIDGGAKGGTILRAIEEFGIPIVAVGSGESLCDISKFSIEGFLNDLM